MEDQLINFETAKLAKEKGFNEECYHTYGKIAKEYCVFKSEYSETNSEVNKYTYSAPSQSLLQKWLREIHNIDIYIHPERYSDGINYCVQAQKWDLINGVPENNFIINASYLFNDNGEYSTYELALEKGLYEGLKLI